MTGGTLGTHADPDLERARRAAERALRDRLEGAGWQDWGSAGSAIIEAVPVLAEVAIGAAWADLKRATRRPLEDGR